MMKTILPPNWDRDVERIANVRGIVQALFEAAFDDVSGGRSPQTGSVLEKRLALDKKRVMQRAGDAKAYKRIYSSVRFLLKTQNDKEGWDEVMGEDE